MNNMNVHGTIMSRDEYNEKINAAHERALAMPQDTESQRWFRKTALANVFDTDLYAVLTTEDEGIK
jgi:hypothetical protein